MTARRLTTAEIDIVLQALDDYAMKEDPDRTAEHDEEIGVLADALVDPENHPVSEIIVLLDDSTEGLEEMPDSGSTNTAPEEDAEAEEASDELDADEDEGDASEEYGQTLRA